MYKSRKTSIKEGNINIGFGFDFTCDCVETVIVNFFSVFCVLLFDVIRTIQIFDKENF